MCRVLDLYSTNQSSIYINCAIYITHTQNNCTIFFLYNKTNQMHKFHKFISAWYSTCFRQFQCPSSGVYSLYTQQWYMSYSFVDCSEAVYKAVWHIALLSVQWINIWWWTGELSETCRVSRQNKFVKLEHLVGFIIKKLVMATRTQKKTANYPINSLYKAYLLSHRDKKFTSPCITHCDIHWETKYQHTKPYNVYDHPNTI
jgi:hypothetical protein